MRKSESMPMDHVREFEGSRVDEIWINKISTRQAVFFGVVSLFLISFLDYKIEDGEVRFTIFYFIPIAFAAWRLKAGYTLLFVFITCMFWFFNYGVWRPSFFRAVDIWNFGVVGSSFATIAYLVYQVRKRLDEEKGLNARLNKLVAEQERLLSDVRRLQDDVLVMCAWSHKIKDREKWISLEEFLDKHFNLKTSHGISPEELEKIQKTIEQPKSVREQ